MSQKEVRKVRSQVRQDLVGYAKNVEFGVKDRIKEIN